MKLILLAVVSLTFSAWAKKSKFEGNCPGLIEVKLDDNLTIKAGPSDDKGQGFKYPDGNHITLFSKFHVLFHFKNRSGHGGNRGKGACRYQALKLTNTIVPQFYHGKPSRGRLAWINEVPIEPIQGWWEQDIEAFLRGSSDAAELTINSSLLWPKFAQDKLDDTNNDDDRWTDFNRTIYSMKNKYFSDQTIKVTDGKWQKVKAKSKRAEYDNFLVEQETGTHDFSLRFVVGSDRK